MNLEEAEKSYETAEIGDKEPEYVKLSDAEKDFTGDVSFGSEYFNYKRGALGRIGAGAVDTLSSLGTYTDKLKVFGGMAVMSIGDNLGSEKTTTVGKEMIKIAQHNIDENEKYLKYASPEEVKSFAYVLGGGAVDYGLMFLTGGVAGAIAKGLGAGVATAAKVGEAAVFTEMAGLSAGEEAQERIEKYKQRTGDVNLENYTPEMAKKNFLASSVYAIGEGILEKWAFKEQKILFTNPKTMLKTGALAALKEGGTEALQSALDIGIDLADGTLEWKELPDALRGMIMEAAVGGTLGFSAGMSVGYAQRGNAIKYLNENLSKAIPNPEERARVATEIVDNSIESLQGIVATELKFSTEFRDKYGDTFNAMQKATLQAMKDSGGYEGMTEDELAQLATENARMFADQTAAEATKRNELIQDVVNSQDIVYDPKTKELRLAPKGEKQGQLLFQEANDVAQRINEIDAEEQANGVPEYTAPTININGVERQTTNSNGDPVAKSDKSLRYFYDWFGDSKVVDEQGRPLVVYHGTPNKIYDILNPGTHFTADKEYADIYQKQGASSAGYKKEAKNPGTYAVYLRMENPFDTRQEKSRNDFYKYYYQQMGMGTDLTEKGLPDWNDGRDLLDFITEYHPELGYDGIILDEGGTGGYGEEVKDRGVSYVVKDPNQIKSTSNRGTFSQTEDNIYLQPAYAGSRVDYDRPSLEAIGSGEGQQVHGWGLYYALDKDVAEGYREKFTTRGFGKRVKSVKYNGKEIDDNATKTSLIGLRNTNKENAIDLIKRNIKYADDETRGKWEKLKDFIENVDESKIDVIYEKGQVHEVDIPESPYLLDEQKPFSEQSDYVKSILKKEDIVTPTDMSLEETLDYFLKKYAKGKQKETVEAIVNHFRENGDIEGFTYRMANGTNISYEDIHLLDYYNTTGKEIYEKLSKKLGSDKKASEYLESKGIKGITYFGETDGRCFVIFNPDDVKVIQKFYQKVPQGKAKGLFDQKSKVIKLFEKADASTLPHELSHYWLDNMWSYATSGLASETYLAQFQAVKDFLGVSPNQKYLTPNQHEKFAGAYEKYIHRGIIPNSIMGNVFDDYERFIRKVYDSIEDITYATRKGDRKAVKLTPDIIKFFDSMITGGIDVVKANELVASQMNEQEIKKAVENNVREAKQVVAETEVVHKENRQNVMTPVKTDTSTSYLTAYEKMTGEKVEAGAVELAKEMERAEKFVSEDLERAKRIVNGEELPPENMLKNTIYLAYNEVQKKLGNTQERAESMLNQALELHRYGQEISSQQLAYNSTFQKLSSAQYWMDRTISNLEDIASKKANIPAEEISEKIKSAVQEGVNQGKTAEEIAKQIADETGLVLYQTEELPKQEFETKTAAYNYVYKYVNERLGLSLTKEQALEITRRADEMMQSLENSIGDYGNPSADYFRKLSDMEAYANSLAPSSALRIYTDLIGPTNLMASVKTPAFNIIANVPVLALRIAGRRAKIGQMTSIVPKENIKQYLKRSSEIFRETGYNLSTMTTDTPQKTILGEKITHFNETSKLQKAYADFLKYGIGYGDLIFKDFAFVDSVALQATKESNGNESKAVELFNDAVRVEPTTDIGKQIRLEAQTDALVSTYQNEGAFASGSLKIRSGIDKMTYGLLGKFFIPFAKTPGNVIGYSAEKAFGPAVELAKGIITGKVDKPKLKMLMAESALAYFLSAALVFLGTDDDDYMPPYALADEKTKQVARELNIPYNSIRIGDHWYSLDIIGPLGAIVSGFLQARRDEGIIGRSAAFLSGTLLQLGSIPGIGGVSNITEGVEKQIDKIKQNKGEEAGLEMIESVTDALYSRTVPAFVSDVAKVFDQYEREAKGFQKIQKKIPFARNLLEEKISKTTGQSEPRGEPITRIITDILAGARIKEQIINDIADEVFRLNSVGEGVNLSDITRSGDLSKLSDEQRRDALIMFAQEYSQKVGDLIKTSSYKSKTDEGKKDAINDVRRAIVKKIKSKYSKELKVLQKKR